MVGSNNKIWLLLGMLTFAAVVLFAFDQQISGFVEEQVSRDLKSVAKFLAYKGIALFYLIFAILLVYSFVKKNRELRIVIWAYIKAQVLFAFILVRCLKIVFGRVRPKYGSEFTFFSMEAQNNSFPSGHSADAFVSGVFLYVLLKSSKYSGYRILPIVYAFLIASSRVVDNAHFASDVVTGITIGIFGAYFFLTRLPAE